MTVVSVVIPVFNTEPTLLREALDSVRGQTVPNVEIVVVDDGSKNHDTIDFLARQHDIRLVRQENKGVAGALNRGISHASGEFIVTMGSDDRINTEYVEKCLSVMRSGQARIVHTDHRDFGTRDEQHRAQDVVGISDLIHTNKFVAGAMFRRSDWQALGGFDESLRVGYEDWEWWVRILATGGFSVRAEGAMYEYRRLERQTESTRDSHRDNLAATRTAMLGNTDPAVLLHATWQALDEISDERDMLKKLVQKPSKLRRIVDLAESMRSGRRRQGNRAR